MRSKPNRKSPRARRNIIVVAASAGGVEALQTIVRALPSNLAASVFVVIHRSVATTSVLERVIGNGLKISRAIDEEAISPSRVFVAPPDRHLVLEEKKMRVVFGPKENGHRPAADVLFRSAARSHGPRVIGVVLTGALSDGAAGLAEVKARGGLTIVQDPRDAFQPDMPRNAIAATEVDEVLPLGRIAAKLVSVTHGRPRTRRVKAQTPAIPQPEPVGTFICPQCGGALRELIKSEPVRFRCHTGHAFSLPSLLGEQGLALESSLWAAVRMLKERAALQRRLAETTGSGGIHRTGRRDGKPCSNDRVRVGEGIELETSGITSAAAGAGNQVRHRWSEFICERRMVP